MKTCGGINTGTAIAQSEVASQSNNGPLNATASELSTREPAGTTDVSFCADGLLIDGCLRGDDGAWAALIDRYKHLIYSFPRRYGAGPQDAADVFQQVCIELFAALPRLRKPHSVRSWIMTVAGHEAYRWKRRHLARARQEGDDAENPVDSSPTPSRILEQAERDQIVRDAIARLSPRNRELVRLLFYEDPPVPYQTVARRLGLAAGSVCFIRMRCLRKLERLLDQGNASRRVQNVRAVGRDLTP